MLNYLNLHLKTVWALSSKEQTREDNYWQLTWEQPDNRLEQHLKHTPFSHAGGDKNGEKWKRFVHESGTYISQMSSGRLAGISVRPLPLQSTTLLLQVQAEGQETELALHDGGSDWGPAHKEHIPRFKNRLWGLNNNILWVLQILWIYKVIIYFQVNIIFFKSTADKTCKVCSYSSQPPLYQSLPLMNPSFMLTHINSFKDF